MSERSSHSSVFIVAMLTILCLVPFVSKAFHVDDIPFLWTAKQIQSYPFDFYGFSVNWYSTETPMFRINQNPPLVSYFIAAASLVFGWNEIGIHLAFLIFSVALSAGTYYLAKPFCTRPAVAALIAILSPVFLVSATSVMTETPMIAFYVWAIVFWIWGEKSGRLCHFFCSGVLIALSSLTKYFGVTLIPLSLIYSVLVKKKIEKQVLMLLVPVAAMAGYQWLTYRLYGQGLLFKASVYAIEVREVSRFSLSQMTDEVMTGLSFTGGCLLSAAFYAPLLWSGRARLAGWAALFVSIAGLAVAGHVGEHPLTDDGRKRWELIIQLSVFIVAGIHVLALASDDLRKDRSPESVLLFLWIFGTFVFSVFVNWTINARILFPMAPAAGIAVMRRFDRRFPSKSISSGYAVLPLIPALSVALAVTYADYSLANTQKTAAYRIHDALKNLPNTVWFQGHWGFRYYMESLGYKPLDKKQIVVKQGDIMVIPENNTNLFLPHNPFYLIKEWELMPFKWIGTMSGAGFYTSRWGPLPFALGPVRPEKYMIFQFE